MNGESQPDRDGNDWRDRAIDAALQEVHGGKVPDLSARLLLALHEQRSGPLPMLRRSPTPAPGYGGWFAAAAMLLLSLAVGAWWWTSADGDATDQRTAQIEVAVFDGHCECVETTAAGSLVTTVTRGTSGLFLARAGNQLRTPVASRTQLGPFGMLTTEPQTILEVRSMEFSLKQGVVAASALTLSVVAGVATWHTLTRNETAAAGETLRMEAKPDESALAAENAQLRVRLAQLERQNETLAAQASRATPPAVPQEPARPEPVAEDAPAAAEPVVAPFGDARYDAALAAIDWKLVGAVTHEMGPMLAQLVAEMEKTGEVPMALAIKIQELNGQLVKQVPAMLDAKLPGFGPNGSYTHPLIVANTLASTLQAAGQPLDPSQRAKMDGLVRAFSVDSQAISDQTRDFDLEQLVAETEMKDRFYKEMSTLLTTEQQGTMYPEGSRGYDGMSLFSSGLVSQVYAEPVPAKDPADFARIASNKLGEQLGLDESGANAVRAVVERMAAASPELWQDKGSVTERELRKLKTGRTPAALRRQLEIMREIQRQVPMTPEQKKKLTKMKKILVPLPR